jgi:DNA-binding transcriptional LysR family regulator
MALVERGLGVALVPQSESMTASKRVRCIPISHPAFFIDIGAVWRRENMSPVVRWFIDCAVQMGREVAAKRSPKLVARELVIGAQ